MIRLTDAHEGQTAYIVGRGPSLLDVTPADFGPGPVITLNLALLQVRALNLPNRIFSSQKDGCVQQMSSTLGPPGECEKPCRTRWPMVEPMEPEVLLVSEAESRLCFPDYRLRFIFDPRDFGLPWFTPSAPTAVKIAGLLGCTSLVMIAHDAFTKGDLRTVEAEGIVEYRDAGYVGAGRQADAIAKADGLAIEWR